jgi:hypothetical protein
VKVDVETDERVIVDARMRKIKLGFGDVVESIAYGSRNISTIAVHDGYIWYTGTEENAHTRLYRMRPNGKESEEIGELAIGSGLAFCGDTLYGVEAWPGRLYKVSAKGEPSLVGRLNINWPKDLAFDGKNLWYIESSGIDNRYGVYALDLESRRVVVHFVSDDQRIQGLAWANNRLWISSLSGSVYEVDPDVAKATGKLEAGILRKFGGKYWKLSCADGHLLGLDSEAKRICKILIKQE